MRRGAHNPIFDPGVKYGAVSPGAQIGTGPPVLLHLTIVGSVQDHTALDEAYSVKMHPTNPNYVVVASKNSGGSITTVDISNPVSPTVAATVTHANLASAIDVAVSGSYAYVACQSSPNGRLTVVDISNPLSLSYVGSVADAALGFANGVAISGTVAFVAGGNENRLVAVDVSTPSSPSIISSLQDATNLATPYGVAVSGSLAYVASNANHRLTVVNVSNTSSMTVSGSVADSGQLNTATRVTKYGNYVLVGTSDGMGVVNVATPSSPTVAGYYDANTLLAEVCMWNSYPIATLHAADNVVAFDFSTPATPTFIDDTATDSQLDGCWGICTDEDTQYCYATARFDDRLVVIQIS